MQNSFQKFDPMNWPVDWWCVAFVPCCTDWSGSYEEPLPVWWEAWTDACQRNRTRAGLVNYVLRTGDTERVRRVLRGEHDH